MKAPADSPPVAVAALELPQRFGDVAGTLAVVDAALGTMPGEAALVLLPEAIFTGYVSPTGDADLTRFAEALDGPTASFLADMARSHGVALAGPLIERAGTRCHNSLLLFDAAGNRVGHWRKRHPWLLETWATPGDLPPAVVDVAGLRVTAAICYDVHFVSDEAGDVLDAADVLLFPTAWVDIPSWEDHRAEILPELAVRHGVWVVNANWAPSRPRLAGQGGSMVVDPRGRITARAAPGAGVGARAVTVTAKVPRRRGNG